MATFDSKSGNGILHSARLRWVLTSPPHIWTNQACLPLSWRPYRPQSRANRVEIRRQFELLRHRHRVPG